MPSTVLQGAGFINVYSNPVISFEPATARNNKKQRKNRHESSNLMLPDIARKELNGFDDGPAANYLSAGHSKDRSPATSLSPPNQEAAKGFLPEIDSGQLSVSNKGFARSHASHLSFGSLVEARKVREQRETDVRKLHNRIALLQSEEEKALKRIEETRAKA